ncbi:MAG: ABC transporter permease [Planctomycetota bacterium]
MAILLAVLFGVPVGVLSAVHRNGWFDLTTMGLILIGISLPTFVTGSALLIAFTVFAHWFPIGGWGTLAHVPLPAVTLSLPFTAYIARLTRIGMLDVLSSDFVRTGLAKGLRPRAVIWKHAFKPAFLPVLSYLGPAAAQAMTGSFVVEKVFGVPGLGQHFVDGALNLDCGLVMSTVLVFAVILVAFNTLVDVAYGLVDPRIAEPA